MKVAQMIEYLKTLDQDAEVYCYNYDWMIAGPLDISDAEHGLKYGEVPCSFGEDGGPYIGYYLET